MQVHQVPCGPAVNESERKAFEQLKARLISEPGHDEWLLLTNFTFSATHHRQSDEIDIVVIGPPGVQIVEVKHWTAAWVNRNSELVEQEADRLTNKARRIGTTLRHQLGDLPRVDGVFLVTETASKVGALEDREPVRGVPFHTFKTWHGAVGFYSRTVLSSQQIKMLGAALEPRSTVAIDGTLKRMAGYARLDLRTPPGQRFHRIYKATHTSRQDRVILHLYDLSAGDDSRVEEKAKREWKSLHRLQQYGWAPRIVDSFQDAPGYPGEIKFFTVADSAAPSVEERAADSSWDTTARLTFARDAVRALADLHGAGTGGEPMVHRNLTPSTVLVKYDNSPILTGFEHARIPADVSVASPADGRDWDTAVSPEVRSQGRSAADHRSDIFSLCASLSAMFEHREDETSAQAIKVLALGMDDDPTRRSNLTDLEALLSDVLGEPVPQPPPPPARFWTEDQTISFRGQSYRIVSRLGSGGVGTTFKVVKVDRETKNDLGTYVAKVARDEETGRRILAAYELAHSHLRHSALSTIFEVAAEWQNNGFVALMTWIEGEPLSEYSGVFSLLAEDLQEASSEALALRWLQTACEALRVLHDNGLVHGDVSPGNMIVSGADLVLTDYDCVTNISKRATAPGTVLYCSPSYLQGRDAMPSDDLYALAASFFQVLFAKEPFQYDGIQAKERGLNWAGVKREEYPLLAGFLDRATDPEPANRLANVAAALAAMSPPTTDEPDSVSDQRKPQPPTESGVEGTAWRENEVQWLKSLLQSYPGSRWGNSETRGLDTEFAENTYVETNLEQSLFRAIMDQSVNLVVLCGNAGDGKTALLQRLGTRLGLDVQTSATRIITGQSHNGVTVRMNLDGSASWQGRSADDLLDEFLAPFHDGPTKEAVVHLLAINDGRLLEWIGNVEERDGETPLTRVLYESLENRASHLQSHIRFVNLNQRSLVGSISGDGNTIDTRFLDHLIDSLYGREHSAEIWAPCQTCSAQERCEVFRATQHFGPGALSNESHRSRTRQRLFEALQAVHLRGETHITVRELRAALVYILFGMHYCSEYHAVGGSSGISAPQPYWDRAFSPESAGRQGEVLRELPRFDPALEAHPQIDRHLVHPTPGVDVSDISLTNGKCELESLRRRAYFEWSEEEIKRLTGDSDALGLAQGHHLREFRDLAADDKDEGRAKLIQRLCGGISRLEALPTQAFDRAGVVPLRITPRTPTETAFWVEKSVGHFHLEADIADGDQGSDPLHRQALLIYRYRNGEKESLRLGANLFHLLLELNDGYQLGDVATDDTFAHLSIFVQRLVREDHRRLLAWNPMREDAIFEVSARIDDRGSDPRQPIVIALLETSGDIHGE